MVQFFSISLLVLSVCHFIAANREQQSAIFAKQQLVFLDYDHIGFILS